MNNKELWRRAFMTDPRAVKPITGKQYSGNSPKPYWIVERLTDEFGPCGIGWGFTILSERFERFGEGKTAEALHVAVVRFWYVLDDKRGEFEQVGQTRAAYTTSRDKFMVDEDAPKKSVTDALVKCASYLGFAGDIFSGMWDDSKYVQQAGREWDTRNADSGAQHMAPDVLADWIAHIESAATVREFKERLSDAEAACNEINDAEALQTIRAAAEAKAAKAKKGNA